MPDLIDTNEAARILGVTQRWVNDLLNRGDIPAQRIGSKWVIDRQAVEVYAARKQSGETPPKK